MSWFAIGLTIAPTRDLSLADYLIKIFLPSAPALLDSAELSRAHWRHASARQRVEHGIDDLWHANASQPGALTAADCRAVQDSTFLLRRDGPRVPAFLYGIRKAGSQAVTVAGADSLRAQRP